MFFVTSDATKPEVKAAVELLFKVQVDSLCISPTLKGKVKRFGRTMGVAATTEESLCLPLKARSGNQFRWGAA